MALPKIDVPIYELELPLSKKVVKFRPFLVKEQKNLLMALEADDVNTIERNIKQVLINCTISEDIDIGQLPIVDVEYYFLNLRARSVGEVVELKYRCNNDIDGKECGNIMETSLNILDLKVDLPESNDEIQITDSIVVKLKYPQFESIKNNSNSEDLNDLALGMIIDSIEYIYDGEQFYYAGEVDRSELIEFVEQLNQSQFNKLEKFFEKLPTIEKTIQLKCSKCGFEHTITVEGLESFFD